jgi:hypothetical protein
MLSGEPQGIGSVSGRDLLFCEAFSENYDMIISTRCCRLTTKTQKPMAPQLSLYLVEWPQGGDWGQHDSFVVRCESEQQARDTHPGMAIGQEWNPQLAGTWIRYEDRNQLRITLLGAAVPDAQPGIVLGNYDNQ